MPAPSNNQSSNAPPHSKGRRKLLVFAFLLLAVAATYYQFHETLTLAALAERETQLRSLHAQRPLLILALAFLLYVAVAGASLPFGVVLSLVLGWLLGFWPALLLVSFASTTGATLAFLTSRYLLRDAVRQRFGHRLGTINSAFAWDGAYYLFTLRLIPAVPFFLVNLLMGLTPIPVRTFWWVSQLGMLPGTAAYVYAGSNFPSLAQIARSGGRDIVTPQLIVALAFLGLFPLVAKKILNVLRPSRGR